MKYLKLYIFLLFGLVQTYQCFAQGSWKVLPNAPQTGGRHEDVFFVDELRGWVVNLSGEIYKTRDGGFSWERQLNNEDASFRSVGFADSMRGWAGTLRGPLLWQTIDGGATWDTVSTIPEPLPNGICGISVVNDSVIYACGRYDGPAGIIKSIDGGKTWTKLVDLFIHASTLIDCYFFSPDSGFVVGADPNGDFPNTVHAVVLFTSNGGRSWTTRFKSDRQGEWGWKISFPSPDTGYVALESITNETYILKTTNGGLTWQEKFVSNQFSIQGIGFINGSTGWVGGLPLTYRTLDGGDSWQPDSFGQNINRFRILSDELAYAVGRTVYKYSKDTTTVSVFSGESEIPAKFSLEQNFPNPFNPATTITYHLPGRDHVQLQVFNISGQLISTLVDQEQAAGSYTVSFDASQLSSGVYLYRIQSQGLLEIRKMLFLK